MTRKINLQQLLADNRRPYEPIQNRIKAEAGQPAAIYLYDPIVADRLTAEWCGGICPQDFVPAVRAIQADEITLYTNCPGGDVFASEAMCQALREHPAKITMQIEGYAASAATNIACACDEVIATPASKYMIHQAWAMTWGNADELLQMVDLLRKCDQSMYAEYARRSGQSIDQLVAWCKAETWFTAEEAVAAGFVDRVLESAKPSPAQSRQYNLSAYANAPKLAAAASPAPAAPAPAPSPAEPAYITAEHRERQQQRLRLAARITNS